EIVRGRSAEKTHYVGRSGVNGIVVRMTDYRSARVLALKCRVSRWAWEVSVDHVMRPCDIDCIRDAVVLKVIRITVRLNASPVMDDVTVDQGSLHVMHVDTIVRPVIAFVALN